MPDKIKAEIAMVIHGEIKYMYVSISKDLHRIMVIELRTLKNGAWTKSFDGSRSVPATREEVEEHNALENKFWEKYGS